VASPESERSTPTRLGLRGLLGTPGFRRLLAVRFTAQWGDGMFQAALGGAVLFNPEREADPIAVAVGLAVLLLPYSIIGPFAGALLDRWDRRRVLLVANLVRAVLTLVVAAMVAFGVAGPPLYLGALCVTGVTRFVLAGLSAALPHVVQRRFLVEANVVAATAGAAVAALGGASAIGLRAVFGAGNLGSACVTGVAALGALAAALVAAGFHRGLLGPDERTEPGRAVLAVARGLVDGARATAVTPGASSSFAALVAHRLAYGVSTLLMLLLFRHYFTANGLMRTGIAGIGEVVVMAAAGLGVAAMITPWLVHRVGRPGAIRIAAVTAALSMLVMGLTITLPTALGGAFLVTAAGQVIKLCADAAVQSEVADDARGRVFALYDAVFNIGYVVAVAAAALLSPADGRSPLLLMLAAGVYLLGLGGHELLRIRGSRRPIGDSQPEARGPDARRRDAYQPDTRGPDAHLPDAHLPEAVRWEAVRREPPQTDDAAADDANADEVVLDRGGGR
jgi:MFS family permease